MVRQASNISKEPEEQTYKALDINPWLEEDETVNDTWVYAYSEFPQAYQEMDAYKAYYLRIRGDDGTEEERLLQDKWDRVKYRISKENSPIEITDDVILMEATGEGPNKRVLEDTPNKFRIGLSNTKYDNFLVVLKFSTDKGRTELVIFGVGRNL